VNQYGPTTLSTVRRTLIAGATFAVLVLAAGCGEGDAGNNEPTADAAHTTQTLEEFARVYLTKHVCPDAPTADKLAERIAKAIRDRPGTTRAAAAMGICNKTRR
jgi:hypothetical protein